MARTLICKLLQKKTYDVLSKKYTILLLFMGVIVILIAVLHFGEIMMEWSTEKYAAVFNPYNDNIAGKSFRTMLCQYVPIDVVYTWVNGTDPSHLRALAHAKTEYGFFNIPTNCTFPLCIKSHMVLIKPQLPVEITLSDLEDVDRDFENIVQSFIVSTPQDENRNITVLTFPSIAAADKVLEKKILVLEDQNYSISTAYITDNWMSENTVSLKNMFIITDVPSAYSEQEIREKFPKNVQDAMKKVFIYPEKSLAVFTVNNSEAIISVQKLDNISFEKKVASVVAANLVIQPPADHEDVSASRFADNEELRYSLRSLEKHAPWVQHIYIVTNGQIPYWLNLDNPRVTIITHEQIFPNASHLPTFSSPAIECHLHRIPHLSKKFLYLNDDVMFGKDVWPEDFYTHTKGQKVYLSWPVPNCAEGCPASWIRDGYCDKPCNNSQCQWDGGDCTADNPLLSYQGISVNSNAALTHLLQNAAQKNYCNDECSNTWLADKYCDRACNLLICGFDAGDCGLERFGQMHQLVLSETQDKYILPKGNIVGFFNLTEFIASNHTITEGFYDDNPVIRTIALSLKYSVITAVLKPYYNATNITISLKGEKLKKPFEKIFTLSVCTIQEATKENVTASIKISANEDTLPIAFEEFSDDRRSPKVLLLNSNESQYMLYSKVNVSASKLPEHIIQQIKELSEKLASGELTEKGFMAKKSVIIKLYVDLYFSMYKSKPDLVYETVSLTRLQQQLPQSFINISSLLSTSDNDLNRGTKIKILYPDYDRVKTRKHLKVPEYENRKFAVNVSERHLLSLRNYLQQLGGNTSDRQHDVNQFTYETPVIRKRHLLDTFGDSLRHVNKLYNDAFGYEARKVPSHIAHFVDADVMLRLTERFSAAFDVTSSHKIRSSNDMQFAFSYYYYLMSEVETVSIDEIFDSFDTDNSGTWSDREIRTVLARVHELPLDFSAINEFEKNIINCSSIIPLSISVTTPQYERYYDSKLPVITKQLVSLCPPVKEMLLEKFGQRKQNKFEIVGEDEVAFKMMHNNLSQVLGQIDDLRKNPKKFVCLNDNMKHGTQEAMMIKAVIQDFYESLFPKRSQFELPPEYRNRFLCMNELKDWRRTRDLIRLVTYVCLGLLILFSITSFWKAEIRGPSRQSHTTRHRDRHKNPHSV